MGLIIGDEGYGETSVVAVKLGSETVNKIYCGSNLVWNTGASESITQKTHPGSVFEGEDSGDLFGWKLAVSGDGNTIVASGYLNDDSANNAGMVRVLRWNGTGWAQIGSDINVPLLLNSSPYFGGYVAISHDGNTIAISGGVTVSIYDWNSSTSSWGNTPTQLGQPGTNPFGSSAYDPLTEPHDISLNEDGTRIAICWPEYPVAYNQYGAIFVYDRASRSVDFSHPLDSYHPISSIRTNTRYYYYTSVSLSKDGNRIACGGWRGDSAAGVLAVGHIEVFEWDSTNSSWSQLGSSIYGDSSSDYLTNKTYNILGTTNQALEISDDGTHVIAGARHSYGQSSQFNSGYAAVWSYNGSAWQMKGSEFRGNQIADQRLGTDVDISSDGSRIVITSDGLDARSTTNPAIEYRYPQIQVYDWNSTTSTWDEVGTIYSPDADSTGLIPQNAQFNSYANNSCAFGAVASLSSDGSKLIASAPGNALTSAGRLLEYELTTTSQSGGGSGGGSWTASGNISVAATNYADAFGYAVALSSNGRRVVAGSYMEKSSSNFANQGAVRVFDFDTQNISYPQSGNTMNGNSAGESYGQSLDANQDATRIVVGAPNAISSAGTVEVLEQSSTGTSWSRLGSLIVGPQSNGQFGHSVGMSSNGNRIIVGNPKNNVAGSQYDYYGKARIYEWNASTSAWTQLGGDINGDVSNGRLGMSVAISGDGTRIAVGAPYETNTVGTNSGAVKVYDWDTSTSAWTQVGSDIEGASAGILFGWAVDLDSDGSRLLVSANCVASGSTGSVYAYDLVGTTWTQTGQTVSGDTGDQLGYDISLLSDGSKFAAGAHGNKEVKAFELINSSWTQIGQDYTGSSSSNSNSQFGIGVAINGDGSVIAVGDAPANTTPGVVSVVTWV